MSDEEQCRVGVITELIVSGMMFGGGQSVVLNIVDKCRRRGREIGVTLLGQRSNQFGDCSPVCVAYDGRFNRLGTLVGTAWRLHRRLENARPQLLHTHGWDADVIGWMAALNLNLPVVVHLHVLPPWLKSRRVKHVARRLLTKMVLKSRGTRIVAVSWAVRDHWVANLPLPDTEIRVIHNGVDVRRYAGLSTAGARRDGIPVIGTAARLSELKGIGYLLEALGILKQQGVEARLEIAGEGPVRPSLEKQARKLGIEDAVAFLGHVEDMPGFLDGIDIYACPSFTEGFPMSVLEAMAAGKPVVASRVGGIPEAIRDGIDGFLVPPGESGALAKRLHSLITDENARWSMGAEAAKRAATEFSLERFGDEIVSLYDEVLKDSKRVRA